MALLALALSAAPVRAEQGDARLPPLFHNLLTIADQGAASHLEDEIWDIWLEHPDRDVIVLMRAGIQSMNADECEAALAYFDQVVARDPDYAEGWNKRANALYLLGRYDEAVADIRRVLTLEPNHFAALTGLGLVYLAIDRPHGALRAFDAALAIDPHLDRVREQADKIRARLAGASL